MESAPETVNSGYEAFGYTGSQDPRGADLAREHFSTFLRAIEGDGLAERDAMSPFGGGAGLQRIEPHSPGLRSRIWWGAGNSESAAWAGSVGVNLMSSTLLTEASGQPFDELQAQQIETFRAAWRDAYRYDAAGRLLGWTRRTETGREAGYAETGARVLAAGADGTPLQVAPVVYTLRAGAAGTLEIVEAPANPGTGGSPVD